MIKGDDMNEMNYRTKGESMTSMRDELLGIVKEYDRAFAMISDEDYYAIMERIRTLADRLTVPEDVEGLIVWLRAAGDGHVTMEEAATALQFLSARERELETALETSRRAEEHSDDLRKESHAIVDRIWAIFGTPSFEELAGRSIYDLIKEQISRAEAAEARVRELESETISGVVEFTFGGKPLAAPCAIEDQCQYGNAIDRAEKAEERCRELEKLVRATSDDCNSVALVRNTLAAENARLRDALETISVLTEREGDGFYNPDKTIDTVFEAARAALQERG